MLILHDSLMFMLVWVGLMLMLIVVDPISISRRVSHSPSRVKEEKLLSESSTFSVPALVLPEMLSERRPFSTQLLGI